jgi:hypothetical protein
MRLVALLAAVLVGCSSSEASPDPAHPDAGTVDAADADVGDIGSSDSGSEDAGLLGAADYCEATADFFCDYYLRCGRIIAASADECRATFLETCNARYEQRYVDLETAGLLALSAAGVEACRDHLGTVACERQVSDLMGPCGSMWIGTQAAGSACGLDVESFTCAPGTACVLGTNLCGVCRTAAALDGACGSSISVTCASDAACVEGRCVQRRQVGESCGTTEPCVVGASCTGSTCVAPQIVREGDACDTTHRCPYRSACTSGRCVRAALLGEDCSSRTCASGRCVQEGSAMICRPLLDAGGTCASSSDCRSALCVQGTCAPLPDGCFQ